MGALAIQERPGQDQRPKPTFKPNAKQPDANRLLNGPAPHVLLFGGSRSGKTFIWVRAIVNRALRASGSRHAIWRKHFNHAKNAIGKDTFPKVLKLCYPDYAGRVEFNNEGIAIFPNHAEIWLAGLDDQERVDKILGMEFATNGFNEISSISWHAVEIAHSRLAQKVEIDRDADFNIIPEGRRPLLPLKNFYDLNPVGKRHWGHQLFVKKLKPGTRESVADPDDYQYMIMNPDDNRENLPPGYIEKTLGGMSKAKRDRFRDGKWQEDIEGALWPDSTLDAARLDGPYLNPTDFQLNVEPLVRVVIGVDPSGAGTKKKDVLGQDEAPKANDIGIVVCGLGRSGTGYVLEDGTINAGPGEWARRVADLFDKWKADKIVAEKNYGGAMVEHTIRTARSTLPVKMVDSSRGKALRAEPVAALYEPEQRKVKHAGFFEELEDQMAAMMPQPIGYTGEGSPDRLDAAVFALTELMLGSTYTLDNL
jgi:phage terminase large subunit-like protein